MKSIVVFLSLVLLGFGSVAEAQNQSRFDWQFYNRAPVLVLVNNDDLTVVRVLTGEEGVANKRLMEASLCLVFYGNENCDQRFLDQVVTYLREGKWQWKVYRQGNIDLDYGLSHGVMVKGVRQVAVTKAPPVIHTKDKTGKVLVSPRARLLDPMEIPGTGGKWVRVAIFEECYNTSGEMAEAPVQFIPVPEPRPTRREIPRSSTPTPPAPIDSVRVPVAVSPAPVVTRYQPEVVESDWNIGLTSSAMVGAFSSSRIAGMVESLTDRQVCVTGRMFDFGFAQGGQGSSIWRVTLVLKQFDKGSYTQYVCANCNILVKTTAETGAQIFGFQAERVQRIKINDRWSVQPMITANVGIGHVSGEAVQQAGSLTKYVGARELFGSNWFPMAGAGLGVMGDLGRNFTWTVTAVGVEYPGTYYGRVGLTYWLK